jgi:type IV secretory pathway VirB3-like protein
MIVNAHAVLLVIAVICFVIAALGVRTDFNLIAIGLAFFAGSSLA